MTDEDVIQRFFAAMQTGASTEHEMMALFSEDAVYVEPFSGAVQAHRGKAAVRRAMQQGWRTPLPEMRIHVNRIQMREDEIIADWTCFSPALPNGQGSGRNVFTIRNGVIVRLETTLGPVP
jgi:ketosteroid isomerase-like protein